MVLRRIAGSKSPAVATARPDGSMKALIPETAASTTHRPVSIARIWLICRCCSDAAVNPYDALFTGTMRNPAPSRTKARGNSGKLFSKQIGVPNAGTPGASSVWTLSPGARSTGICSIASDPRQSSAERHVLAERDEVHLVVPADRDAVPVVQDDRRALAPVGVVRDGADDGRGTDGGDRVADPRHHDGVGRGRGVERSLSPDDQVGRRVRSRASRVPRCSGPRPRGPRRRTRPGRPRGRRPGSWPRPPRVPWRSRTGSRPARRRSPRRGPPARVATGGRALRARRRGVR